MTERNYGEGKRYDPSDNTDIPDDCLIDFDMRLIDLFAELDRKHMKIRDLIRGEYYRIKELLGYRPSRMDLFTYMDDDVYQMTIKNSKENIFKRYMDYLDDLGELSDEEKTLYSGIGREFINLIETTNMSKVYKMPVLMAFYNNGNIRMGVTEDELLRAWKEFFNTGTNWKDLEAGITYDRYKSISDKDHIKKILQMPVHFLQESGKGFFVTKDGFALALRDELKGVIGEESFAKHMGDVIEYRAMDYYRRRYRNGEENET